MILLHIDMKRNNVTDYTAFLLRIFDASGNELASDIDSGWTRMPRLNDLAIPSSGALYAGVSVRPNNVYDPVTGANSDTSVYPLSPVAVNSIYELHVERRPSLLGGRQR